MWIIIIKPSTQVLAPRVFTLQFYSKFRAGEGDLELFCTQADELHKEMLSCPRPLPRIATTPLPPTPKEKHTFNDWSDSPSMTPPRCLLESRRMSRSEGDLKKFVMQQQSPLLRSAGSQQHLILLPQNDLAQKVSLYRGLIVIREKDKHLQFT